MYVLRKLYMYVSNVDYLLLCNKLHENLVASNSTSLSLYNVCELRIQL